MPLPARPAGIRRAGGADGPAVELPVRASAVLASDSCGLQDLAQMCAVTDDDRRVLVLTAGWGRRWMTTWKVAGEKMTCPAADMGAFPVPGCEPVRHFAWATSGGPPCTGDSSTRPLTSCCKPRSAAHRTACAAQKG